MAGNHKKLAHLFDVTQCIGCSACIVACAETNYPEMMERTNEGWNWLAANIRKVTLERARHPVQLLVQCQQCDNAPCVTTCPFGANYHDPETGQVKTDPRRCIGCSYCVASCPYDCRWAHPDSGLPMENVWVRVAKSLCGRVRILPVCKFAQLKHVCLAM